MTHPITPMSTTMYLPLPPLSQLSELLDYDQETGILTWKKNRSRTAKMGDQAGCVSSRGYMQIMINRKKYMLHRIAWLFATGVDPVDFEIDHVNGDKCDNRISNLRRATRSENIWNQSKKKSNTSGFKGVSWSKQGKGWVARIGVNWKKIDLGLFDTKEAAYAAYQKAANRYHGDFANYS